MLNIRILLYSTDNILGPLVPFACALHCRWDFLNISYTVLIVARQKKLTLMLSELPICFMATFNILATALGNDF
jgi:hypothetical protein